MLGDGNCHFGEKTKALGVSAERMGPIDLLSPQLPMVSTEVPSGNGRDKRGAAGVAVRVPLFCQ